MEADDAEGAHKHYVGAIEFAYGLLISPTCDMTDQATGDSAHPNRVLVPVVSLEAVCDALALPNDKRGLLSSRDQLHPYLYLPAVPGTDEGELVALLFRPTTVSEEFLRTPPRRLAHVPDGARAYMTCGDDDARAFAGRPPAGLAGIQGLFLGVPDAITLTGADGADAAAEQLAETIPMVVLTLGARGLLAIAGGHRVEVPDFDARPVVDPTGDRDLMCAAYAWADMRGASVEDALAWAWLYTRLAMTVPTATGGALTEERLLDVGAARGLVAPSS